MDRLRSVETVRFRASVLASRSICSSMVPLVEMEAEVVEDTDVVVSIKTEEMASKTPAVQAILIRFSCLALRILSAPHAFLRRVTYPLFWRDCVPLLFVRWI